MSKNFLFWVLLIASFVVRAQEETDEFEIVDPSFEINSSKEDFRPDQTPEPAQSGKASKDSNISDKVDLKNSSNDEDTVLVRTREESQPVQSFSPGDTVEIRYAQDVFLPYKQRQKKWGWLFSIGAEQAHFPSALSQLDDLAFEDVFGKKGITMTHVELGPKFNTSWGSFGFLFGYGFLNKEDGRSSPTGLKSEITMTRYSASVLYYLDTLFSEPYFVPYVGGGIWQIDYRETSEHYPGETGQYTTEPGTQWRVGALIGLDWIEGDSARIARKETGMQGTYLNVYAISTMMSESDPDPDLENEMDIGGSLVIEF